MSSSAAHYHVNISVGCCVCVYSSCALIFFSVLTRGVCIHVGADIHPESVFVSKRIHKQRVVIAHLIYLTANVKRISTREG